MNQLIPFAARVLSVWLLVYTQATQAEIRDPDEYFFNQTLGDYSEELELAKESAKKGLLIMFVQDDCPFCARMKATVLNRSEVQAYFQANFLIFHVDIEGDIEIRDMQGNAMKEKDFAFKLNRVRATPVFIFYDLKGEQLTRYTGPTSGVDDFMLLGKYVVEDEYRNQSFTRYKQNHKKSN
ncbi:MAG: thioredoxin family protein [Gammaproteobacteria bacterium]